MKAKQILTSSQCNQFNLRMLLFFIICLTNVHAQISNDHYLGQKLPGKTPELFAQVIVSKENSKEHCLAVSPKGDEMFFTSGEKNGGNC